MKDYYQIMGVPREASNTEIKRSYRKLAVRYHPDKNPSADAEALFKEINEAYEVLIDPITRAEYDQRSANPGFYSLRDAQPGQDQRYQPRPGPRFRGPSDRTIFMRSMLQYTQLLFYFGCLWCSVLVTDYMLPSRVQEEVVVSDVTKLSRVLLRDHTDLLVTDKGHHFPVLFAEMKHFPHFSSIRIHTSNLLSAVVQVENHDGTFIVNNLASIYRNFSFAPILLLLSCLVGIIVKKGIEFHVNLGIVVFLLMILNIVFLFTSQI